LSLVRRTLRAIRLFPQQELPNSCVMCGGSFISIRKQMSDIRLHMGDCLDFMRTLESGSVDAVVVDLPYFEIAPHEWDRQWKNRADYLDWVCSLAAEWQRILRDNGSIFLFADEKTEAYIQVRLDEMFFLLNKIVWFKTNNLPQKNAHRLRSFAPMTERALFYEKSLPEDCSQVGAFATTIKQARVNAGYSAKQVAEAGGFYGEVNHGGTVSNWESGYSIPSFEQWEKLTEILPQLQNKYHKSLREQYEALRRPFNPDPKTFDVIQWDIIGGGENTAHPTTKPLGLMKRIISIITDKGQTVLDCCMGSGTTGVAAVKLGRNFIGCEINADYYKIAERRIAEAQLQPTLLTA